MKTRPAIEREVRIAPDLSSASYSFIDLFSGCGGFTLGLVRAGLRCVASIDSDAVAVSTMKRNLPEVPNALCEDLTTFGPVDLSERIGMRRVDVIVGGPPCQGFSVARQVDGSNHGSRLIPDARRYLYQEFLRYVEFFQPRVFVIENVLGLRTAAGGEYLTRVQHEARALGRSSGMQGYRVHGQIESSWALGVPQKRRRQLIIGVRADIEQYFRPSLTPSKRADLDVPLGIAIGDLPVLRAGGGSDERQYDANARSRHIRKYGERGRRYLFDVLEAQKAKLLTNHVARPHSPRDLRDFSLLKEGESSAVAMRERHVKFEFPYDTRSFKDRYTRQSRNRLCSTIVAHLAKDGLMFIHPTQNRSLTPREAARIQSFPDWFRFPSARTHAFRLIGNAVPPLVSEAIGNTIRSFLNTAEVDRPPEDFGVTKRRERIPFDFPREVLALLAMNSRALRSVPREEFLSAWRVLLTALPDLHPRNALDHGDTVHDWPESNQFIPEVSLLERGRFTRSGWPVALEEVGKEAWRRHQSGTLDLHEIYAEMIDDTHSAIRR